MLELIIFTLIFIIISSVIVFLLNKHFKKRFIKYIPIIFYFIIIDYFMPTIDYQAMRTIDIIKIDFMFGFVISITINMLIGIWLDIRYWKRKIRERKNEGTSKIPNLSNNSIHKLKEKAKKFIKK